MMKKLVMASVMLSMLLVFSCGSTGGGSGGGGGAAGEAVAGTWEWEPTTEYSDGNDSTCFVTVAEETIDGQTVTTYSLSGTVTPTVQYGESQARIIPDEATLELLRKCTAISFKIQGDGRDYIMRLPTATVKDWGFHMARIKTEEGQAVEVNLPMRAFLQPSWAQAVRFSRETINEIEFTTRNNAEGGLGDWAVKIWDFKLIL